jgi:phosphate:Na+ symporter
MALGANLGGALVAVGLTVQSPVEVRRVVLANLMARGGGAGIALWALGAGLLPLADWATKPADQVVLLHVLFNATLLVVMLPFAGLLVNASKLLLPEPPDADVDTLSALDEDALSSPVRAVGCARREVLRMGEEVESLLRAALPLHIQWDEQKAESIQRREARIDKMNFRLKMYLSKLMEGNDETATEARGLATFAAQLESAGDEISTNLVGVGRRLHADGLAFSGEGWAEIQSFHAQVVANAQLALDVVMTQDAAKAKHLVAAKDALRGQEERLQTSHFNRLRQGLSESLGTTSLHQETLRILKAVNSAMAVAANPILEKAGLMRATRLTDTPPA